jgi:hypothetical protein
MSRMGCYELNILLSLRQVGGTLRVIRFPPPIELTATILFYYCLLLRELFMLHCKFYYYYYNVEFESVFRLCLEWDVMN